MARVSTAAIWSLANAKDTPKNVTIEVSVLGSESKLRWAKVRGIMEYDVVRRAMDQMY